MRMEQCFICEEVLGDDQHTVDDFVVCEECYNALMKMRTVCGSV